MDAARRKMLSDGLIAGLIGYFAVAFFFAVWNLAGGQSLLRTPALLGEAVFAGLRDPESVTMDPGAIFAFNGVHLVAFLGFGYFAAWLVHETELHPEFWYLAFFLFLAATVMSYAAVLALTVVVGSVLSAWLVVVSSLVGAAAMAVFFAGSHRQLVRSIRGSDRTRALGSLD